MSGRRRSRPFEPVCIPRISTGFLPNKYARNEVADQQKLCNTHDHGTNRDELIHGHQMLHVRMNVRVCISPRESSNTKHVHWEECSVEPNEGQNEMKLRDSLAHHPAPHLREPELNGSETAKQRRSKQHIVEVSNDEVSVMEIDIDWHSRHEDAAQATDDEHRNKGNTVQSHSIERNFATPNRPNPVEHLNCRRKSDHHR